MPAEESCWDYIKRYIFCGCLFDGTLGCSCKDGCCTWLKQFICCGNCFDSEKDAPLMKNAISGPVKKRECTDIFCLFIYLFFLSVLIYCSVYGFYFGNLQNIGQPFDANGNRCGRGLMKDFPRLFFNDKISDTSAVTGTVCVANCPTTEGETRTPYPIKKKYSRMLHQYPFPKMFRYLNLPLRLCRRQILHIQMEIPNPAHIRQQARFNHHSQRKNLTGHSKQRKNPK